MILFINGCVRQESRTLALAKTVLSKEQGEVQEVQLFGEGGVHGLDGETLALRNALSKERHFDHPLFRHAVQFAAADTIVLAAPYWDLLFPSAVRAYLEAVTVSGITFFYDEQGIPQGLCRATRLIYVTTAGGPIVQNLGFEYVDALAKTFYGIADTRCVLAQGLDIVGADPAAILAQAQQDYLAE